VTGPDPAPEPIPGRRPPRWQVFYCPYCGEEDLRPEGDAGAWHCGACARSFAVRGIRPAADPAGESP
jgi:ribosomal protein L37AE/L43A